MISRAWRGLTWFLFACSLAAGVVFGISAVLNLSSMDAVLSLFFFGQAFYFVVRQLEISARGRGK
jgi:hypothetical protein